jgi:hypothetical protein
MIFFMPVPKFRANSYIVANENLYLSPTLNIKPTDQQYDVLLV